MNTFVSIGRSQDYRLARALLVYGTSSYDGFPYRHPFVVAHEVEHDGDNARLSAGQLLTSDVLGDLLHELGESLPVEILPERVLVRSQDTVVWWTPGATRVMFFSDAGGDTALAAMNGAHYPHPALVFKACGSRLWVKALQESKRPGSETPLMIAPYWNCAADGAVCIGSMKVPTQKSIGLIDVWEQSFFQSEFTHANGGRVTNHPGGIMGLWKNLRNKKTFPVQHLLSTKQTLAQFVNPDDKNGNSE